MELLSVRFRYFSIASVFPSQCFSEPAGSGKQINFSAVFKKLLNQPSLIYIEEAIFTHFLKKINSDR